MRRSVWKGATAGHSRGGAHCRHLATGMRKVWRGDSRGNTGTTIAGGVIIGAAGMRWIVWRGDFAGNAATAADRVIEATMGSDWTGDVDVPVVMMICSDVPGFGSVIFGRHLHVLKHAD